MEIILKDIHRVLQPEIVFKTSKFNIIFKSIVFHKIISLNESSIN